MVKDYAEDILQAMEIVVGKCLNDIAYDKTEICTIIGDKDKKNGRYTVTNGSAKFDAFVDTSHNPDAIPEYKLDDSVRVSIPNGDYSQKKYIQGLNITDNDTNPITYVSPLDTVLDMTDNIISGEKIRGLRANDANQSEWCIWSADCSQPAYRKLQNNSLYDTIAIKGDFKTLLTGYNVNSGSYGLRLDMYFKPTNGTDKLVRHSAYLDSSDMYGNPYSFLIYSTQAVKFSIANIGTIQTISLYFYQKNNFTYLTDNGVQTYLPMLRPEDKDYSNLLLKNVYLSFGSDIVNIDDNTVKLYTNEPLEYDRLSDNESINTKGIGLLWYNKNDAGQYLGYSDGIVDRDYDEIAYLQLSEHDSRLLAQQGKDVPLDESGLDLSADIVEAEKLLEKLTTSITQDLYQMLWAFYSRIEGVVEDRENNNLKTYFDDLTNSQNGLITQAGKSLEANSKKMVDYYLARLSNARAQMDKVEYEPTKLTYVLPSEMMHLAQEVVVAITNKDDANKPGLLEVAYDVIKNNYAGFMSLYDSFNIKLTKLANNTQSYIDDFLALTEGNDNRINAYFREGYEYTPYVTEVDESLYENRYCIYWYRYVPGYVDETERFMESGWKRLTEYNNHGLPSATTTVEGIEYYEKRPDINEDCITQIMDTQIHEEKYCVIIFYNHTMYKSDPLVFTNANPPQDGVASDQSGALYIEHGTNSRDTYQSYGVNNMLINVADAYQTRQLTARYEGLLGGNEVLLDGQIFWYIPKNATMLTYDLNEYGTNFTNDINDSVVSPNSLEGYTCFYRTVKEGADSLSFTYHIKDYYVPTSTNNDIICKVITKDGRTIEANIMFNFSSYGTSGTDYTLVITPSGFKNAITEEYWGPVENALPNTDNATDMFFDFDVKLFDYNNEQMDLPKAALMIDDCGFIGPKQVPYMMDWIYEDDTEEKVVGCRVWIPNHSKGPSEQYYYGILQVVMKLTLPEMKDEQGVITQKEREVNLTSYCALPFSSYNNLYHGQVYIEGPSIIVYDSSGTNPTYYKNPYKAYSNYLKSANDTSIVEKDQEITDISWIMKYYNEDGDEIDISKLQGEAQHTYQLLINWMPKLSSDNKLVPASMYLEEHPDSTSHLYPVVVGLHRQKVIWAQPIYLLQNKYESAMLNEWDGSLCIDEKNGTIMSSMVGAGRKTVNNTFEGVLMGNVGAQADIYSDNAEGIGIFGFHDGAQSFHFGVDGTAFIGKSGRGRIRFDGNSGTIASASYYATRPDGEPTGDAGMLIDLDDGFIDIKGVKAEGSDYTGSGTYKPDGYQARITLNAKADEINPYFRITSPNINLENEWNNKDLIYVGLDEYFLQTENYTPGTFSIKDAELNAPGKGMKIDLMGAYINAFNLQLISKNILLDCTSDIGPYLVIKADSGNNLMYVSSDAYYLKTDDYVQGTSGLRIDLDAGSIKAYNSFSLEAGSEAAGGVMLNAKPTTSQNYLFAGKTSTGFIKVDGSGAMSLYATAFTLEVPDSIYLSNTPKAWTVNGVSRANIVLGLGTNFGVDKSGNLYANNATINNLQAVGGSFSGNITSSANISGGTIEGADLIGGNIYVPTKEGANFSVDSTGKLVADSANIGGWEVGAAGSASDGFRSGSLVMSPSTGLNYNELFTVDDKGNLKATGAELDTLTVKNGFTMPADSQSTNSMTVYADKIWLGLSSNSSQIWIDGKTAIGGSGPSNVPADYRLLVSGNSEIAGDLHVTANTGIATDPDENYTLSVGGKTKIGGQLSVVVGSQTYSSFASANIATFKVGTVRVRNLTFANGILVKVTNGAGSEITTDESDIIIPDLTGNAGKVLTVKDNDTMEWAYVKKKFDVTMTGTASVDMSGYYTRANGATRYSAGGTLKIYQKDGVTGWTTGTVPTGATTQATYYLRSSSGTYCYTTSAASAKSVSVTLKGTSGEITLDGGNATNGNIAITITGATAS